MVSGESQHAMDAAKQAVAEFMKRSGHHDTTVHERVLPAVTHQTITKTEHEEIEVARDVESHVDHWHYTLQPLTDAEDLEVQHRTNVLPVERKHFEHDDREEVRRRVAAEGAKFRDEVVHVEGEHTHTDLPPTEGSHYHHHLHEVIQPILNRHTLEPWIVHTAHQIHEVHHLAARHHQTSMLPAVTLAEFKKQGGILTGREERIDFFLGEPKSAGGVLGDSERNPLPRELRVIGQEEMMHHTAPQPQEHAQPAPSSAAGMPTISRAPTGQGSLARQPTGPPPTSTHQVQPTPSQPHPSAPLGRDLHPTSAGSQAGQGQAPQSQHLQPTSIGSLGLMPLLARSAGDATRPGMPLRTMSRTPQPTQGLHTSQASSQAQQASAQGQQPRQGSTATQSPQRQASPQSQQPGPQGH